MIVMTGENEHTINDVSKYIVSNITSQDVLTQMSKILGEAVKKDGVAEMFKNALNIDLKQIMDNNKITAQEASEISSKLGNLLIDKGLVAEPHTQYAIILKKNFSDEGLTIDINTAKGILAAAPFQSTVQSTLEAIDGVFEKYCEEAQKSDGLCSDFANKIKTPSLPIERDYKTGEKSKPYDPRDDENFDFDIHINPFQKVDTSYDV